MTINVDVIGQKLKIVSNTKNLVSGSQNFIRFFFNLDSDWDGLTVFAQFQQNGNSYNQTLDGEKSAYLPAEITDGKVNLLLYGTGGTVIATVNYLTFTVDKSIIVENAQSTQISTPIYTQIINRITALVASPAGSGGDVGTEVRDARVGWDGTEYNSLGDAVRGQLTSVNNLSLMGGNAYINEARFSSLFGNDFNNVPNNRIYPVGISNGDQIDHSPGTVIKGTLITFGRNNSRMYGDSQVIVTLTGAVWHRTFWRDDNMNDYWTEWTRQTKIAEFKALDDRFSAFDKPWNGLKLSVLGDSISTFPGKIPQGNDSYYTTSGSKSIASVNSMWWNQVCDILGAEPLVIEAWSGTCCADPDYNAQGQIRSGREDRPSAVATSYVSNGQTVTLAQPRCQSLHKTDTSSGTSVTVNPDIIVVALGCNDYYYNVPLGTWDGHGVLSPSDTKTWRGAYANMILKIQSRYPDALIFCFSPWFCVRGYSGTSPENVPAQDMVVNVNGLNKTYQDYEDAMREICEVLQCVYIDTNNFGFTRSNYQNFVVDYNEGRGETVHPMTHPNAVGQEILGQSIASAVRDKVIGYVNWLKAQRGA